MEMTGEMMDDTLEGALGGDSDLEGETADVMAQASAAGGRAGQGRAGGQQGSTAAGQDRAAGLQGMRMNTHDREAVGQEAGGLCGMAPLP